MAHQRIAHDRAAPRQHADDAGGDARLLAYPGQLDGAAGVISAGLSTTAQPAASAGASFWASLAMGEFHGVIAPTTPSGSCRLMVK